MLLLVSLLALHLGPVSPTEPNRQPQMAAEQGTVALVFGSGDSIWLAKSTNDGKSFGAPAKVAGLPKMLLGRHRGPRIVFSGGAMVVSAVQSDLYYWRSTDGGKTWSKPGVINDQPTAAREGLHAMAADGAGNLAAAWLDDRIPGGKRLWGAFSHDGGATWGKNVMLYESPSGTICQCCHPSLVALGRGEFAVMWRNALDGSRDFYTLRLVDGKPVGTAAKMGTGTWKLDACPMDGGGLAMRNGELVSAWRREKDLYLAESGKPEVKLGTGQDVSLAVNAKGAYTIWSTAKGIEARLPGAPAVTHISDTGAFPSLLTLPDGSVLAAWEENGSIATRRLD